MPLSEQVDNMHYKEHVPKYKKKRIQRACDMCRRKKTRCNGDQMPGNQCSHCVANNIECSYIDSFKKRMPPKGYVESLESRLAAIEDLFKKYCPDVDLARELEVQSEDAVSLQARNTAVDAPVASPNLLNSLSSRLGWAAMRDSDDTSSSEEEFSVEDLSDQVLKFSIKPSIRPNQRFIGKSSGIIMVRNIIAFKEKYAGPSSSVEHVQCLPRKRPEFWEMKPWEVSRHDTHELSFPSHDLLLKLVDLYFENVNIVMPVLHRPTFDKSLSEGLQMKDEEFGGVVLLVCALGSRYCDDPRVYLPDQQSPHSRGWKWFIQLRTLRNDNVLLCPSLYIMQLYCLVPLYMCGTSVPQACWTVIGAGLRLAQDVGIHRRKAYNARPTIEDELWKRAFWVLLCLDRSLSASLGRSYAIQDEDFDLDPPIECDDEYWTNPDPDKAFKQPEGVTSMISFFVSYLKLNQILAFALRTIYSSRKTRILLGFTGDHWEQQFVAEIDSALNAWQDSVPEHLRWDPDRRDRTFFLQSAILWASYYHLQIYIHRPFIPSPGKQLLQGLPSLTICTNAARCSSNLADVTLRRQCTLPMFFQASIFTAGVVLLLHMWGQKRSRPAVDCSKDMEHVLTCLRSLKDAEDESVCAGRLGDILGELASVGETSLRQHKPAFKSEYASESDHHSSMTNTPQSTDGFCSSGTQSSTDTCTSSFDGWLLNVDLPNATRNYSDNEPHQGMREQAFSSPTDESLRTSSLPTYGDESDMPPLYEQSGPYVPRISTNTNNSWFALANQFAGVPIANCFNSAPPLFNLSPSWTSVPMDSVSQSQEFHQDFSDTNGNHTSAMLDNDTLAMWSNMPSGFNFDDWGEYITHVSGSRQEQRFGDV